MTLKFNSDDIPNSLELERMVGLLAISANVMRKLAGTQSDVNNTEIKMLADTVDTVASRLVDILYPVPVDRRPVS